MFLSLKNTLKGLRLTKNGCRMVENGPSLSHRSFPPFWCGPLRETGIISSSRWLSDVRVRHLQSDIFSRQNAREIGKTVENATMPPGWPPIWKHLIWFRLAPASLSVHVSLSPRQLPWSSTLNLVLKNPSKQAFPCFWLYKKKLINAKNRKKILSEIQKSSWIER